MYAVEDPVSMAGYHKSNETRNTVHGPESRLSGVARETEILVLKVFPSNLSTTTNPMAAQASSSSSKAAGAAADRVLRFHGHHNLRSRLTLSLLTGRPLVITGIRAKSSSPGLRDYEAGFLRLLDKITNGTKIEIGYTGTSLSFRPGSIQGGAITHDCGTSREIGYFLEWIVPIAPFAKKELALTLKGITTGATDMGVDVIRTVTLPTLSLFLPTASSLASALELRITARGAPPLGGGSVFFRCPLLPNAASSGAGNSGGMLRTLNFVSAGRIKRIRGVASATRVSPQMANRMVEAARGVLNRYIPDLYLFADVYRGEEAGKSPGFGLSLVSTSTTGALHCAETFSMPGQTPEEVALTAARTLLTEISLRGCITRSHQPLVLLLMALGPEDVGSARFGELTEQSIVMLRDLRQFLGVVFQVKAERHNLPQKTRDSDEEDSSVEDDGKSRQPSRFVEETLVSCVGSAIRGARKVG
jgi:RNA 3'-terminal phosphate cyclase-like protein